MRYAVVVLSVIAFSAGIAAAQERVQTTNPFAGVRHEQIVTTIGGRPQSVHVVEVSLCAPGLRVRLTPANGAAAQATNEQTTRAFLVEQGAQIAVNAHFFTLDGLPTADLVGLAASDGDVYSPWVAGAMSAGVNIGEDLCATLITPGPSGGTTVSPDVVLYNAIGVSMSNGANPRIVTGGVRSTMQSTFDLTPNPRTIMGILPGCRLLLVTVDGRQPGVAEGVTLPEAADYLIARYGVTDAVNLDGGGSTTLVMDSAGPRVMNTPVGVGSGQAAVNTERSNGTNLAIFAERRYSLDAARELIAYEGFEYANRGWGNDTTVRPETGSVNALNGGTGWSSQWSDTGTRWSGIANYGAGGNGNSGIAGDLRSSALNYTDGGGRALPVRGGQFRGCFGTSSVSTRQLDLSLEAESRLRTGRLGADGTTLWVSFLAQSFSNAGTSGTTERYAYIQLGGTLRLGKLEGSPTGNWGAQDTGNGGLTRFGAVASGGETMILARIEFRAGSELLSVWTNPASLTDADALNAPAISMPVTDFGFADVSIVNRYSTDFDELRLGWTFGSVVGAP
ncbi:MAG: phosphodiester glycosidase family protein [Phycisphaerales bacterium]